MPIRATSIRGQLRFWWRATQWLRFSSLIEMQKEEASIWGSTDRPSNIQLTVFNTQLGKTQTLENLNAINEGYAYGTFPLRETDDSREGTLRKIDQFSLEVRFTNDDEDDIAHNIQAAALGMGDLWWNRCSNTTRVWCY